MKNIITSILTSAEKALLNGPANDHTAGMTAPAPATIGSGAPVITPSVTPPTSPAGEQKPIPAPADPTKPQARIPTPAGDTATRPPLDGHVRTATDHILEALGPDVATETLSKPDRCLSPAAILASYGLPGSPDPVTGIKCGRPSNGLCLIMVKDKQSVEQFFQANPTLAGTMVTTQDGLHCVWVRFTDSYPDDVTCSNLRFISCSSVVITKMALYSKPPLTVATTRFAGINWPAEADITFFLAETLASFGPYYRVLGPKKKELNQAVFARIIARRLGLAFDADAQTFHTQIRGQESSFMVTTVEVFNVVLKWLSKLAAADPANFPVHELRLPRIRSLVETIKTLTEITRATPRESLIEYIRARLCLNPAKSLSVQEIHTDYLRYGRKRNLALYPQAKFFKELPAVMLDQFTIGRVNNVMRQVEGTARMTARRGFRGVTFRTADVKDG